MQGVMNPDSVRGLPHVAQWLSFSLAAKQIVDEKYEGLSDAEKLMHLVQENVLIQKQHIMTHPHVAAKFATGKLAIHAWCYDIGSGDVQAYDELKGAFVPVEERYQDEVAAMLEAQSGCGA
ncbi:hypothetical protein A3742_28380 [Oleiphilus sp. HI0071]|nr:hypothetical protein A3742_28380 [Oleiphilus sp. HI0071]